MRAGVAPGGGGGQGDATRAELEEQRDFLLRSLDDLERERHAGELDDAGYRELKDGYTARAAAVLRALEALEGPGATSEPAADAAAPAGDAAPVVRRGWVRPAAWALAVVVFAGVAGALVARSAGERAPGAPASGAITPTGPSSTLARARQLIGEGKVLDAVKAYDQVIAEDPRNAEALAYRGWLVRLTGRAGNDAALIDKGLAYIDRAIAVDPSYPDARFFRGLILLQDKDDPAGAITELRAFLANDPPPDMVPLVEGTLREAMAEAERRG